MRLDSADGNVRLKPIFTSFLPVAEDWIGVGEHREERFQVTKGPLKILSLPPD